MVFTITTTTTTTTIIIIVIVLFLILIRTSLVSFPLVSLLLQTNFFLNFLLQPMSELALKTFKPLIEAE